MEKKNFVSLIMGTVGGILFAIAREMGVPVKYVGVGEGMDDLMAFDAAAFADALFLEEDEGSL